MATYLSPGIYVEETPSGARPIQAVGTSLAGFVGEAPDAKARVNEAVAINNWSQFVKIFATGNVTSTPLAQGVYGFFQNGGGRCYVVNTGRGKPLVGERAGLNVLEEIDEIAIVAAPGYTDAASSDALLEHCERLRDRVAILDAPEVVTSIDALTQVATAEAGGSNEAGGEGGGKKEGGGRKALRPRQSDGGYGAFYFPWIVARDPLSANDLVVTPPSGHLAGIYARTDTMRGVHKAPANEAIRGAVNVTYRVTRHEQEVLNPAGVNCIRFFPREGIRVWGARTLAPAASEWRYINVRRLFNMIEESIAQSTRWVVFEPNDRALWKSITRDVSAFLTLVWREGALMGRAPEEAFFVRCDDETNPTEVIDSGMVVTLIGIAPVKPAEFVIFRIGQTAAGAEVETAAGAGAGA